MSRHTPAWLQLLVIAFLVLQGVLPVLSVLPPPAALAEDTPSTSAAPPSVDEAGPPIVQPEQTVLPEPPPTAPIPPSEPRLPQGSYMVHLPADGSATRFADLPIELASRTATATGNAAVRLEVLAPELAGQLSPAGVAFTLTISGTAETARPSPAGVGALQLTLDYGQMHLPTYGGGFEERLTLYRVTPCAETPATKETRPADCQEWQALPGSNDLQQQRLTVVLDLTATELRAARVPFTATHRVFLPFSSGGSRTAVAPEHETLLVLAAAASSGQGDYAATPFNGSSDYQLALAVGAMQTSYAAPLPPAAGGLAPDVTLRYDSGSVDGMTTNKNNQPGWAGIGWNYEPGAITRRLKTCGTPEAPGDLCLTGDNYTIALNGVASPLVKDANGLYHPQNDPRWKIQKLTNGATGHPDTHKEYWLVTTPDGTKYRFGGEFDPDKTTANDQDSAFYVPVYDQSCSSVSAYWVCNKAWKWNLDRVEDTNGNVIAFYYQQETNYYNVRNGLFRSPYVRAGNVARIEYGRRTGSATVPTQVKLNTAERCEAPCASLADYPDTPGDLGCLATGTCSQNKPTFWSLKRLDTIYPQYWNITISQWITVAQFALSHAFVKPPNDPNGSPNDPKLWLNAITQKSADGATALPAVQYGYVLKPNRRDNTGVSSLTMPRINQITDPLGGVTTFTYGKSHECPIQQSGFEQWPYDCFPAWNPAATPAGFALFNKWKVLSVSAGDSFSGNATQTTTYTYSTPINHYDDDPVTPSAQKSYSDFRGSAIVTETDASGAKTEHRFHRGMNGDVGLAGTAIITLSNGETRIDENWLRGREVETRRLRANDNELIRSANWFTTTLTAGSGKTGAYFVGLAKTEQTTTGSFTKNTRTENSYDSYGNLTLQVLHGDLSTTADDRTIQRSYVYSPTGYLMNRLQWEKLWAGTVSGAAGQEKAYTAYAYDNLAVGAAPTKGNRTLMRAYSQVTPTATYVDTTTAYDTWGRPTGVTDPNGRTTTTAYHTFYGYAQSVTNALSQTSSTVVDPGWGAPTSVTDLNGRVTTVQYDAFGRLVKVWLPSEPTNGPASKEFVYTPGAQPAWIKTRQLKDAATSSYLESWGYFDGFGRSLQTQTPLADGSRALTSQAYNALGQVAYSSTPYQAAGAAGSGYVAPSWATLSNYQYNSYNELGQRWLAETKSYATTLWSDVTIFDAWWQRHYVPYGNNPQGNIRQRDTYLDAFGQTAQVVEFNAGSPYTTTYSFNLAGNLTGVTDAAGNVTSIG